ncbi:MAG: carboxypeptidase-like regulatory domain-containing protein, partial [Chitinophaga sp.]
MSLSVRIMLFVYPWLLIQPAVAQQGYTVSGYVRDSTTGESLIGASIGIKGTSRGVQTNTYGFYAIT